MTVFFSSDLHFGHANIAAYSGRPFLHGPEGVDVMNAALIDRWNDRVDPSDTVYVLGDVAMGKIADSLPLASKLHGEKFLVAGNHDRCWSGNKKADAWRDRYVEVGFRLLPEEGWHVLDGGLQVTICHFPFTGDSGDEDRHVEYRPTDEGQWLLHGHVHDAWLQRGRMINVGVDAWGGSPASEDDIRAVIAMGAQDRDPLAWVS